jgi:hypothetical protein
MMHPFHNSIIRGQHMFLRGTTQLLPYGEGKGAGLKFLMWAVEQDLILCCELLS